jgi:lipopolysaccharide biosynthesis glycosyltransferase
MTNNILLCFDSNYNTQAEVTIMSLLNNTFSKLSFFIIHSNPETTVGLSTRIKMHKNTEGLKVYKFKKRKGITFPNFDESHMTEATYYRLFLSDYLPDEINTIMYIDPDIVCINNFDILFQTTFEILNKSEFILSARTEHYEKLNSETVQRLELSNQKYFNAGVTFINFKKWQENQLTEKLIQKMNYLNERVMWFDQDILNSQLDGMYNEIPLQLNFTNPLITRDEIKEEAVFYHYSGKKKPWTMKGILEYGESFYQENYRAIFDGNYHIVHRYKKDSILHFMKFILSFKFMKLQKPLIFIFNFITSMKKPNNV